MRQTFKLGIADEMVFNIEGERFGYRDTQVFAEIANMHADIYSEVRVTKDGRAFYATIVSSAPMSDGLGVRDGWYVVRWVDAAEAWKIRESWAVLRPQDDGPDPFRLIPKP